MKKRTCLKPGALLSLIILAISGLFGEEAEKETKWIKFSNDTLTVVMAKTASMETIYGRTWARRLGGKIRMEEPGLKTDKEKAKLLINRLTTIFEQVKKLRELDPEMKGNERIVILQNQEQLGKMFMKLYNRPYRRGISFYSPRLNTIFTTEKVINAQILAHEMTHMVNNLEFSGQMDIDNDENTAYKMEVNFRK